MALKVIWSDADLSPAVSQLSLRQFWQEYYRTEFSTQSPMSLSADRNALGHWERYAEPGQPSGPRLEQITEKHPAPLRIRTGMLNAGCAGSTVRKVWRELKAILNHAVELEMIAGVPRVPRRQPLCRESHAPPRELCTDADLTRLFENCAQVQYPSRSRESTLLWRVLLAVDWTFGPRTQDLIAMPWSGVLWSENLLRFHARKVNKLQGLPMPPMLRAILDRWRQRHPHGERVFQSINPRTRGFFHGTRGRWVNGWRACWVRDINAVAKEGPPKIDFQDIRQCVVTRWRASGVGPWLAGHAERGVSDRHYTQPSDLVRSVMNTWEPPVILREFADGRFWDE